MKTLLEKTRAFADKRMRKGASQQRVAQVLLETGIATIRDGDGKQVDEVIIRVEDGSRTTVTTPRAGFECAVIPADLDIVKMMSALQCSYDQFLSYAKHHDAKLTEEGNEKGLVNHKHAAMCAEALGNRLQNPDFRPVESDSANPAPVAASTPVRASDAAPDRAEILTWIDVKIAGAHKNGMTDTANVLLALRSEIDQHVEAAPIDFAVALRAFYADCHDRNVKAGWWSDLVTGEPKKRSVGELFILFVTELVEAYDAYIAGDNDDKLPHHPGLGVELGDLQIRLADFCGALQAGRIVGPSDVRNPGDAMFRQIAVTAAAYEKIRKTPEAVGEPEQGEPIDPQDVAAMTIEKLAFNATRADHKIENRKKEGGKQT